MKFSQSRVVAVCFFLVQCCGMSSAWAAGVTTQSLTLLPGWNAVFIELDPDDDNPETTDDATPAKVFANSAIQMVWALPRSTTTIQYISDPAEIGVGDTDWRVYIPASQPSAALTNLHAVAGGNVYLVKLAGADPLQLNVQGRPGLQRIQWRTESFNLVGFHADPDPARQVSFADFLALPVTSNPAIYTLVGNSWTLLSKTALVEQGKGYWVYNDGTFNLTGPLDVDNVNLNGVGYDEFDSVKSFNLVNRSGVSLTAVDFTVEGLPLSYFDGYGGASGVDPQWQALQGSSFALGSGKELGLLLAVDRTGLTEAAAGVMTIRARGMRLQLPLQADPMALGNDGLWVGTVFLNQVSNVNGADLLATETAPSELTMKLLIHKGQGQVNLLKQVYILGNYSNPEQPQTVLVSDDQALPYYVPLELARGENRGHRLSSAAYDFAGTKLPLSGDFDTGLSGDIVLDPSLPTHPLKHRRNPDHDNLRDDNGESLPATGLSSFDEEVWTITRHLSFTPDSLLAPSPSNGLGEMTGIYQEVITGLHKQDIVIKGRFNLQRVSQISILDPTVE